MPDSPYAGLNPFSVKDAPFFFGRDNERDLIVANLMASRLTVLYGPSGVGKSSVLNAGALNTLRRTYGRAAADGQPQVLAVAFQRWQTNPAAELTSWLSSTIGIAVEGSLIDKLAAWSTGRGGRLLLILDQFEEYLLYHERANDEFGTLLPQVLNQPGLAVNVLISIREDSVARLDAFKGRVPNLFQNYLRLDRLTRESGRLAVIRPLERFNQLGLSGGQPVTIEPALVDAVLDDVRTGQLTIGEGGRGRVADRPEGKDQRIETAYLQLVMKRLWEAERSRQSDVLQLDTYRRLGGAQRIVEGHLDDTVKALSWREQAEAAAIFEHLVTPTKSKIAHTSVDLANYAHVDEAQIATLLEKLSGPDRILATVAPSADQSPETRYQIFHDVLASAVLAWTAKQRARREQRRRVLQVAGVIAILAILATLGVLIQRTTRQARLIGALQRNHQDIAELMKLQTDLHELATKDQAIESQIARLERDARDAKATQLTASLSEVRKNLGDVAAKGRTLAEHATRVGTSLENNQRQIAQSQGVSEAVQQYGSGPPAAVPVTPPLNPATPPANPAIPPPNPNASNPPADPADTRIAAETGVKAALQQYADAYSSLQIKQVEKVFPTFNRLRDLEQSFNGLQSYHMVVTPTGSIQRSEDLQSATVTCSVSGTFQPKGRGQEAIKPQSKTFYLHRRDSGWVITKTVP